MGNGPFGWSRWSPHLGNFLSIATGVPVVLGGLAGVWTYVSGAGLSVALVALAVFVMSLWGVIGLLVIYDWSRPRAPLTTIAIRECGWMLRANPAVFAYDPGSDTDEWQVRVNFINDAPFPLRFFVDKVEIRFGHLSPISEPCVPAGILLPSNNNMLTGIASFPKGTFNPPGNIQGSFEIEIRYGHPGDGYTRRLTKRCEIYCRLPAHLPPTGALFDLPAKPGRDDDQALPDPNAP